MKYLYNNTPLPWFFAAGTFKILGTYLVAWSFWLNLAAYLCVAVFAGESLYRRNFKVSDDPNRIIRNVLDGILLSVALALVGFQIYGSSA